MKETGSVTLLRDTIVALVRREAPDLTSRQLGVLLVCSLSDESQTVRGLAEKLKIPRPAVTRVLDRLTELGLARRRPDPLDQRSVFVQVTAKGLTFVRTLGATMNKSNQGTKLPSGNRNPAAA